MLREDVVMPPVKLGFGVAAVQTQVLIFSHILRQRVIERQLDPFTWMRLDVI